MKLRNMNAHVTEEKSIIVQLESGEILNLENALVLHSYSSRVAVYCNMRVYLLPRYDYSVTTWRHVHAFVQDFCVCVNDYSAPRMREIAREGVYDDDKEYAFAAGILEGFPSMFCTRDFCENFGMDECQNHCPFERWLARY